MKIKRFLFISIAAIFTISMSACAVVDSDPSLDKSTGISEMGGGIKPFVTIVSAPSLLPGYSDDLNNLPPETDTFYVDVSFSREIREGSITTNTVYVNDASATGTTKPRVAVQSVEWLPMLEVARLQWTSDSVDIELVVTSDVEDITGENLCGLASYGGIYNSYPLNETTSDARINLDPYGTSTWAPDYTPEVIFIGVGGVTDTDAVVQAGALTGDIDTTIAVDESNFTITPAISPEPAPTGDLNVGVIWNLTGLLTEDTEYEVTFDTTGIAIDHTLAWRTYPDGTTPITIIGGQDVVNSYQNGGAVQTSDYEVVFKTDNTGTPPTVVGGVFTDETAAQGYDVPGDLPAWAIVQIEYDIEMDAAAVVDTDNYIVYNGGGNAMEVDITPYYETGDTFLHRVLISTKDYSQNAINAITIKHGVVSTTGLHLDGDGDGAQEGGSDYNLNGTPDDWVNL